MGKVMDKFLRLARRGVERPAAAVPPAASNELATLCADNELLRAENASLRAELSLEREARLKLEERVRTLEAQLVTAAAIIKELQSRLSLNSRNSSKPPSSDGPAKPRPKSLRPQTGRRTGGQRGHKGSTLEVVTPDLKVDHIKNECDCGLDLSDVAGTVAEIRQVHDIIMIKIVTDHRRFEKVCHGCGKTVSGVFPEGVNARVQYGWSVESLVGYCMNRQLIPFARTAEFLRDVFKISLSEATLGNFRARLHGEVKGVVSTIKSLIMAACTVRFDETGFIDNGRRRWLHSASTDNLVYFHVTDGKGSDAMREIGILPAFTGNAIHDHNRSYYMFDKCRHGECNVHVIRDLIFLHEERGQAWAPVMINLLLEAKGAVDAAKLAGERMLADTMIDLIERAYDRVVGMGFAENPDVEPTGPPKRGKRKRTPELNLLIRFRKYKREHLLFIHDFDVPFDNNGAERTFRPEKTRQKISGTTRAENSAEEICAIRSYIATAVRNGVSAYDAIRLAVRGKPFVPAAG